MPGPKLFFDRTIDYHGFSGDDAVYHLEEALCQYYGESILIIHGKGNGILKKRIRDFLRTSKLDITVEYGELLNLPGGDGVTVIYT